MLILVHLQTFYNYQLQTLLFYLHIHNDILPFVHYL